MRVGKARKINGSRHLVDDRVYACRNAPNVSDAYKIKAYNSHLTLKILHNIQKAIVHVRFILELDLDSVEVAQRVSNV